MAIITALAAAVRFATLDAQSFWFDEALTVDLVGRSFGGMLDGVFTDQAQPPLYFVLAWLWAHVFGDGEVGLRSLSALLGTLTVPVAFAIGNAVAGRRAAISSSVRLEQTTKAGTSRSRDASSRQARRRSKSSASTSARAAGDPPASARVVGAAGPDPRCGRPPGGSTSG